MNRLYRAERESRIYYGWIVVGIVFLTLLVSAAINSLPSVLILSLEDEFGWDRGAVSAAASIRILLYGLMGLFAAACMLKFGIKRMMVISIALLVASILITPV